MAFALFRAASRTIFIAFRPARIAALRIFRLSFKTPIFRKTSSNPSIFTSTSAMSTST